MSVPLIHEILPGCLMLPPLHFTASVWTVYGTQTGPVWTGKWWRVGGPIELVRLQEMGIRRLVLNAKGRPG
jgi:hypothetical protein